MAMPGVSSGLNHSFEIHTCGLIRSPRSASSSWRSATHRLSHVRRPTVTLRSLKRSFRSSLSGKEAQANLRGIKMSQKGVTLGAMVRWREIEDDQRLKTAHPLLKAAVAHIAHYQIRNRGTVGGSLAHADPAAEMPGIAITCDAETAVVGKAGARVIQAADFFQGALTTALTADEIIVEVRLPAWPRERRWAFEEFARCRGDFAMAAAAVFFDQNDDGTAREAHVGVVGVADRPLRPPSVEAVLNGRTVDAAAIAEAEAAASAAVDPQNDIHASAAYRRALAGTMVERALKRAAARPQQ